MIEEGRIFEKTVVLISSGEDADTVAKLMCESFSSAGYITKIFKITDIVKSFCLLLGWDGWNDERGKKLINDVRVAGERYDKGCWANLLDALMQEDHSYPFDIVFIPDCYHTTDRIRLEQNPVNVAVLLNFVDDGEDNLFLDIRNNQYIINRNESYSKIADKANTIVENILKTFTIERKLEETK